MRVAIGLIPSQAAITVTNRLGAHLSERPNIYVFPERARADWMVIDTRDAYVQAGEATRIDTPFFRRLLSDFERESGWRLVFDREDVRVYRRIP